MMSSQSPSHVTDAPTTPPPSPAPANPDAPMQQLLLTMAAVTAFVKRHEDTPGFLRNGTVDPNRLPTRALKDEYIGLLAAYNSASSAGMFGSPIAAPAHAAASDGGGARGGGSALKKRKVDKPSPPRSKCTVESDSLHPVYFADLLGDEHEDGELLRTTHLVSVNYVEFMVAVGKGGVRAALNESVLMMHEDLPPLKSIENGKFQQRLELMMACLKGLTPAQAETVIGAIPGVHTIGEAGGGGRQLDSSSGPKVEEILLTTTGKDVAPFVGAHSPVLYHDLGNLLGKIDARLTSFGFQFPRSSAKAVCKHLQLALDFSRQLSMAATPDVAGSAFAMLLSKKKGYGKRKTYATWIEEVLPHDEHAQAYLSVKGNTIYVFVVDDDASYDSCCAHKAVLYRKDDTIKVEFIKDKAVSLLEKFANAKAAKVAAAAN